MLDRETLRYLDASGRALGLSLRLARVVRGDQRVPIWEDDLKALTEAANQMHDFSTLSSFEDSTNGSLFTTPEGLEVVIRTLEAENIPWGEISAQLRDLIEAIPISKPGTEEYDRRIVPQAQKLETVFRKIHESAREFIAKGSDNTPKIRLAQTLSKST